jgi:hypothetical protein
MTLLPQQDTEIRKQLRSWLWRDSIVLAYFGVMIGFITSFVLIAKGGPPAIAWPFGIGGGLVLGVFAAFRWSKRSTRKLAQYHIIIEGDAFRVKGIVNGGMQEVRFHLIDVQCVVTGIVKRSALVAHHPLIKSLDAHALTVVEKNGTAISFMWAISVFSRGDLKIFFDHLHSKGVEAPLSG